MKSCVAAPADLATVLQPRARQRGASFLAGRQTATRDVVKSLNNGKFASLLTRLRLDFDYIIVDSAPTPVVSDGLLIGKLADGVILVVRPKISKAPAVFAAHAQCGSLEYPHLAVSRNQR